MRGGETKRRREKTRNNKIKNKKGDITINSNEIQRTTGSSGNTLETYIPINRKN
jgi:hypothetical protein